MRLCVALALIPILASGAALAAGKGKGKGKRAPSGPNMDSGDPVLTEVSNKEEEPAKGSKGAGVALKARGSVGAKAPRGPRPRDPFVIFASAVLGFGRAPLPGPASEGLTTDATLLALIAGVGYDVSPAFTAGLRVPWSTASMEQPGRSGSEQEMAFGSPEVFGEYRVALSKVTTLPIQFGIGAPLAQGDPDPNSSDPIAMRQARVNLLADAAQGWKDSELYAPKRLPIVVGLGVRYQSGALLLHAYDKVIVGIDMGTELLPRAYPGDGQLVLNDIALRNVTGVGVTYDLLEKPDIWAGLEGSLVYTAMEPLEFESSATNPSPLQVVAEPRVGARFGKLRPSLGLIFPIGGRLADSGMSGVRLHVDYAL